VSKKRRFTARLETVQRDLMRVIRAMQATSLHVNQDILEGTAEIVFDREGQRYVFRCGKYPDPLDNLRAAQLAITYIWRAIEEYGVVSEQQELDRVFAQFFLGFAATPDDTVLLLGSGREDWWQVLGVEPDSDQTAIRNAYRALARVHHPDAGGNPQEFGRLEPKAPCGQEAYRDALAAASPR